ncbi:MAG: hypothetical protein KGL93_04835 [Gemmatimonadota bacterium]|nr:hypothetical protein [Gemmatimonadota bacterium]
MATSADVHAEYAARAAELRARRVQDARAVDRLGNLRLIVFVSAGLLVARWATATAHQGLWIAAATAASALFVGLVRASGAARRRLQHVDDLAALMDEAQARVARAWDRLPVREWGAAPSDHAYAIDLDLFGEGSLVQLMPPMSRAPGRSTLYAWLVAPAAPVVIAERQRAVAELRVARAFREDLAVAATRIGVEPKALDALAQWAAGSPWFTERGWLTALTFAIPIATVALIAAQATGATPHAYWLLPAVAAWILTNRCSARLRDLFAPVVGRTQMLRRYAAMARLVDEHPFDAALLASLRDRLRSPMPAHAAMRRLTALADSTELRLSPMLYYAVQTLTLWDFHVARAIERWQRRSGARVAELMAALGEIEALAALGTLSYDNPDWVFPALAPVGEAAIAAEALGHPLLADRACVRNDVTVGPAGTMLVVTGSNMAGKSTLLRSLGLNLVLSQAGSVVCARRFRHPPALLFTSMRVQDSLQRGVSYFMAELERLKLVVDAADAVRPGGDRVFVYLLDEILHGTNSAERTVAARHVLRHLAGTGAIGAVSTHDLQLVDDAELAAISRHVHFREEFSRVNGSASMTFDYVLRPGKATSSNALKLLEIVGLKGSGD